MIDAINGFYAAYLTAAGGNGLALLVFRSGIISGADLGGVTYDGKYTEEESAYRAEIIVRLPPNIPLVQGMNSGPTPDTYTLTATLPDKFTGLPFVRIGGKNGPVNARFVKLRDLE